MPDVRRLYCPRCSAVFRRSLRRCPNDGALLGKADSDPLLNQVVAGRYRIEAVVGDGGMGRVYRAGDADGGPGRYAIKTLYGELAADPRHMERFAREAARSAALDHPNLVCALDFGTTDGQIPYVAMPYVEGRSLAEIIRVEGPLPAARAAGLLADLCRALDHIHGRGIVHRDVKTGNVLVTDRAGRETALLFDFGLAVDLRGDEARITTRQTAVGTLSYMSPERTLCQTFDHRADLFSLGVVLYQMLAGQGPFAGTPMMVAIQNMTLAPPPVAERVPGLVADPRLEAVAHTLMARDPASRYQSAGEVLRALEGIQ